MKDLNNLGKFPIAYDETEYETRKAKYIEEYGHTPMDSILKFKFKHIDSKYSEELQFAFFSVVAIITGIAMIGYNLAVLCHA